MPQLDEGPDKKTMKNQDTLSGCFLEASTEARCLCFVFKQPTGLYNNTNNNNLLLGNAIKKS